MFYLKLGMLVPDSEEIPVEDGDLVPVEEEHLDAVGKELQHFRVWMKSIFIANFSKPKTSGEPIPEESHFTIPHFGGIGP